MIISVSLKRLKIYFCSPYNKANIQCEISIRKKYTFIQTESSITESRIKMHQVVSKCFRCIGSPTRTFKYENTVSVLELVVSLYSPSSNHNFTVRKKQTNISANKDYHSER